MAAVLFDAPGDQHRGPPLQRLLGLGLGHVGEEDVLTAHRGLRSHLGLHKRLFRRVARRRAICQVGGAAVEPRTTSSGGANWVSIARPGSLIVSRSRRAAIDPNSYWEMWTVVSGGEKRSL